MVPFLLSCEDDNFLSLPADPNQQNLTVQQTRIAVPFSVVRQDSVNTLGSFVSEPMLRKRLLAGQQANELGFAEATIFLDFTVGPRAVVGDTAAYQSLELELLYERSYGATQAGQETLEVRRLTQPFDDEQGIYYNSSALAFADPVLGTVSTGPKLTGELDTLRFRLDDTLGQSIFDLAQAGDSTVLSGAKFRDFLPGLALVPTENSFVSSFDPIRLRLIMNFTDAQGEVREHTFTVRRYFSQVTGNYAGTPLAGLTEGGSRVVPDDGNLYLQSGAGVAPRIKLDSLLAFVRRQEESDEQRIRLNRVDLRVGLRNAQDTLNAPDALLIYDLSPDSLGFLQRTPVFDNRGQLIGYQGVIGDQSATAQATVIPRNGTQYSLPVSRYLSSVVDRGILDQRLYLWANDFESSLSQLVTSGDSIYLDVNYTVLTLSNP